MKHTIIIYASQYGSTKRYAERLSATTGIKCVSRKEAEDIREKVDFVDYDSLKVIVGFLQK